MLLVCIAIPMVIHEQVKEMKNQLYEAAKVVVRSVKGFLPAAPHLQQLSLNNYRGTEHSTCFSCLGLDVDVQN